MLTSDQKETMTHDLVIMNEINTIIGDRVLYFYKNKNDSKYQGPFYFEISGKNKSSFKVKSTDESGNICQTYKRTQVKSDGSYYQTNITSLPFTRSGGDYTVYKIPVKPTSKPIIIKTPLLPSTPQIDKKQEVAIVKLFDYQKEDLEIKKYYRKVKLDIYEYVDKEDAEKLGLDKPIYGDDEGYIKVIDKQEDGYIVKFMNLENFLKRAVIEGNVDTGDFTINKTLAKKIKNQELDLDEMDNEYAEITFDRIIEEVLEQYKSNGKKGIQLQEKEIKEIDDQEQQEEEQEEQEQQEEQEESAITDSTDPNILNNLLNPFPSKPKTHSNDPNILDNLLNAFPSKPITCNTDPNILNNLLNAFSSKSIIV